MRINHCTTRTNLLALITLACTLPSCGIATYEHPVVAHPERDSIYTKSRTNTLALCTAIIAYRNPHEDTRPDTINPYQSGSLTLLYNCNPKGPRPEPGPSPPASIITN